jgi:hypothetical protein
MRTSGSPPRIRILTYWDSVMGKSKEQHLLQRIRETVNPEIPRKEHIVEVSGKSPKGR